MAYVSPANDVSQAASKQSCNGRDGEKLKRKECKKVCSPRRSNDRSGHGCNDRFMQCMIHRLDDVALTTTYLELKLMPTPR
jgi:hypothetical protein